MEGEKIKKRIKREKPNKKWSEEDIIKVLNYLQEAPEIEAPTAQIFYKKLIDRSGIDATWELVRWKVRHLKASFKKASDWRKSTGSGLLDSDAGTSTIEGKVLQLCPHYKQLNEIYGEKNVHQEYVVIDTGNTVSIDDSMNDSMNESMLDCLLVETDLNANEVASNSTAFNCCDTSEKSTSSQPPDDSKQITTSTNKKAKEFAEKLKKNAPKSSAAHLATFQAERTELFKIKLEWEREKYEKEAALSERKLNLEEEKIKRETELKVMQLEKEERLRILEIEKDERVQKFEIELKYKYQTQK